MIDHRIVFQFGTPAKNTKYFLLNILFAIGIKTDYVQIRFFEGGSMRHTNMHWNWRRGKRNM